MAKESSIFPLSFAQQRLWFLDQLEPDSPLYNIPQAFRLSGVLNVEALHRAFDAIVARHESLRTTISPVEEIPMQCIAEENGSMVIPVIDLTDLSEAGREVEARRLVAEEFRRPFKLAQGPLLRVNLLRLAEQEHILLLNMSHIVSDGWSMGILMQEISTLYEAFSTGSPSPLPMLPIQYADFTVWQREWLQGAVLEAQVSYWKKQLGGNLPLLELPTDHPRPAVQTYRGKRRSLSVDTALSERLKALSQQEGVTLFMTLLAAFQTLLRRYTGQDDIIVGSPIANRNRIEIEGLIGFFVNTLVLRSDLSGNPTFRELLGRVREVALEAYAHQDVPFEKLVEELQVARDLSYNPLFQVMLVLQNAPPQSLQLSGLTLNQLEVETETAKFDLMLDLSDGAKGLTGALEYSSDLFDASSIDRMVGHFKTLLEGIAANPEMRISDLPLLTEAETCQLVVDWNATAVDYPRQSCVQDLFEAQVERTPDRVAVVFEGSRLTYGELNHRANQLAHYLQKLGVGPEVLVGIFLDRSLDMMVGLLGILKAGGAYVPLDPSFPLERLALMLEDAEVPVLLTQERQLGAMPAYNGQVICLDTDWEKVAQGSIAPPVREVNSGNLAYVIFTSGSTGKPKGVQISHGAVVNFLFSMRKEPGFSERDILLSVTTLSFDIAALELFLPLITGGQTVLVSREIASDGVKLLERLGECGATVMQATPITWRLLLEAGWQNRMRLKILCGGEALPRELASQLLERVDSLWNMYGPTETTIWSAVYKVEPKEGSVLVGSPIANTQIYILDCNLQPVPVGVVGELHIGGDGLARGYLNRPELTRERFIGNPFSGDPGSRLYKTGDLARYRPDGNVEVLGRLDHQVKVRGFRIELGEIEAALCRYPGVREGVVVAREDVPGDKRLVAYIVSGGGQAPSTSAMRRYLKEKLPEYMVPSAFVLLEKFPLTPNRKIDRRSLPSPTSLQPELESAFVAPRTEIERTITTIWQGVLQLDKISVNDNFFDLGGTSISVAKLMTKMNQTFNHKLPMRALYQAQTVSKLAVLIGELMSRDALHMNTKKKKVNLADAVRLIG